MPACFSGKRYTSKEVVALVRKKDWCGDDVKEVARFNEFAAQCSVAIVFEGTTEKRRMYDFNRFEWKPDGCGELAPDPLGRECSP